jgi:arylamine N-acetyltransferase
MVNLIRIGDQRYHSDVGFGGNGPIAPMLLDKSGTVQPNISPCSCRLQWRNIPGNTDPDQRLWVYEVRIDENSEFIITYCFTELEFQVCDFNVMNYYTSTNPRFFFTRTIIVEKKIAEDNGAELSGSLIMSDNGLKWRIHGQKTKEINFESEDDRIQALKDHFNITLGAGERASNRGLASELK